MGQWAGLAWRLGRPWLLLAWRRLGLDLALGLLPAFRIVATGALIAALLRAK